MFSASANRLRVAVGFFLTATYASAPVFTSVRSVRAGNPSRCGALLSSLSHSAARHTGDINLEQFTSLQTLSENPKVWVKASEQLSLGEMPPKGMPQPSPDERTRLLASIASALKTAAHAHAGDPGPVVLRRLNNADTRLPFATSREWRRSIRQRSFRPTAPPAKAS